MNEKILWPLFSKPIFKAPVDVSSLDLSSIKWSRNYKNWISTGQNVLALPEFAQISEQVYTNVCEYFYGIMQAKEEVEIYFTESWLNKTEKGQTHHRHWHPNSILSGIVYLSNDGDTGKTKFITSSYETVEYGINDGNLYNSKSWSVAADTGTMLLFPSSVEHMVDAYDGETPRITLAFNTFIRGNVNADPLTRLHI